MDQVVILLQAEHGIRDIGVTGVQACALPISPVRLPLPQVDGLDVIPADKNLAGAAVELVNSDSREYKLQGFLQSLREKYRRSEERRVGKEGRSRWSPYH